MHGKQTAAASVKSVGYDPSESSSGAALWLGDESWAVDPAAMVAMSITHRLQCNMHDADAKRWMAEQWCDCPSCPARMSPGDLAALADIDKTNASSRAAETQDALSSSSPDPPPAPPPPPLPHPVPRPFTLRLRIEESSSQKDSKEIVTAYLPLFDDEPFALEHAGPLLRAGAQFIYDALDVQGGRVYVHCEKGCSRSPSVVVQYLVEFRNFTLVEAAAFVKARRCRVSPNGGYVDTLVRNEQQIREGCGASASVSEAIGTSSSASTGSMVAKSGSDIRTDSAVVLAEFRRPWLNDFRAGRVRPHPVDRIL